MNLELNYSNMRDSEILNPNPFDFEKSVEIMARHQADFLLSCSNVDMDKKKRLIQNVKDFNGANNIKETEIYKKQEFLLKSIVEEPSAGDLIPKKHWRNSDEFIGSSLDIWSHPHLNYAFYKQLEMMSKMKRSKYLVVIPCTMRKPYSAVQRTQRYAKLSVKTGAFDAIVFSVIPVFVGPYDASTKYPFANYSWNHNATSPVLDNLKFLQSCRYFAEAVRMLGYEKLIFIHNGGLNERIEILKKVWRFSDDSILDPFQFPEYLRMFRFSFSTRELPEPKKFWDGVAKGRVLESSPISQFLVDYFGDIFRPHVKAGLARITDEMREYANYDHEKMKKVLAKHRLPETKSSEIELW